MTITTIVQLEKRFILARYLDIPSSEFEECNYDDCTFEHGNSAYKVYTDAEANAACAEYISEKLWAFSPGCLSEYTGIDCKVFNALSELCEGGNDAIAALIEGSGDMADFIAKAISTDGRGHFMNTYDGDEHECDGYYIYRIN